MLLLIRTFELRLMYMRDPSELLQNPASFNVRLLFSTLYTVPLKILLDNEILLTHTEELSIRAKFCKEFPINFILCILAIEFCRRNTDEVLCNHILDGTLQSLIRTFWISTVHLSITNKAFPSDLLLSGRMFLIIIFCIVSEALLNVNNSYFFHVRLQHVNLLKVMLKQPSALNDTIPEFKTVTLFISIIFLMCSVGSQISLLF